jgi:hypothetical protein
MDKKIINREFITEEEHKKLLSWFYECEPNLTPHPVWGDFRRSNALFNLKSNSLVTEIGERILKDYGLKGFEYYEVRAHPCFLSRHIEGGFVQPHVDPFKDRNHFRFNLFLSVPDKGGMPVYDSKVLNVKERDIVAYEPDKVGHSSTPVVGSKPRITVNWGWSFEKSSKLNYDRVR